MDKKPRITNYYNIRSENEYEKKVNDNDDNVSVNPLEECKNTEEMQNENGEGQTTSSSQKEVIVEDKDSSDEEEEYNRKNDIKLVMECLLKENTKN